jgi:TolA-binding protein
MRTLAILALVGITAVRVLGAAPTTCGSADEYGAALCAYQRRQFADAERAFRAIAAAGAEDPKTVRAHYFLARTLMKTGRYEEASATLIRIYALDKPFYDAWACDFLLGECRRALGKQ